MFLQFKDFGVPVEVEIVNFEQGQLIIGYYSIAEDRRYMLQTSIEGLEYIVGLAPYGNITIWSTDKLKRAIIKRLNAEALLNQQCKTANYNLPSRDLFENYMKQFTYRYQIIFEKWDKEKEKWIKCDKEQDEVLPKFEYIDESLFDGTYDKLHDGGLMNYHQAGKPKKLAAKWHIKKSEYTAYFWFDDEEIRTIFERFYGTHPETKTDFMIRIDSEKNKYELALYRYGLKEPQVISESAYQLLVFKNKFEYYRSENYDQPKGAWIW